MEIFIAITTLVLVGVSVHIARLQNRCDELQFAVEDLTEAVAELTALNDKQTETLILINKNQGQIIDRLNDQEYLEDLGKEMDLMI